MCFQMNPKPRAWAGKQGSKHGYRLGRLHQAEDAQSEFGWSPIRTRRNSDAASEMSCNWWAGRLWPIDQLRLQVNAEHCTAHFYQINDWKLNSLHISFVIGTFSLMKMLRFTGSVILHIFLCPVLLSCWTCSIFNKIMAIQSCQYVCFCSWYVCAKFVKFSTKFFKI